MRFRYLALLLPMFFFCCNKQDTNSTPKPPAEFSFTTIYDSVYTCYPNSNVTLSFNINVTNGDIALNPVTYSVTGLPSAVTVLPANQTVRGVLGGAFTVTIGNILFGTYTANFIISSTANGTETHKLTFNVLKPIDNAPKLAGAYFSCYDFCQPDSSFYYSSVVSTVVDTPYEITISNIKNLGAGLKLRAWISNVVTVPLQYIGPYTIWGNGIFFKDTGSYYKMAIDDTLIKGSDTEYCTIHIER